MKIRPTKVKNRMKVLRALPYKGSMIYIRRIDGDMFTYDLIFNGEIYSSYLVMIPKNGSPKFTEGEVNGAIAAILMGATTTVDTLLGETDIPEDQKLIAEVLGKVAHEV